MLLSPIRDWRARYAQEGVRRNADRMISLCEPQFSATVLDVGCGDGEVGLRISERVGDCRGDSKE